MSRKHLSLKPQDLRLLHCAEHNGLPEDCPPHRQPEAWRYEERGGLDIIVRGVGHFRVPVRMMRAYLRRLDRKE